MDGTIEKLVGVKQVLMPEFKAAEAAGATKGYMWFVRDKNISLHNYIYLGSRLYGEAEIDIPIDSLITNITSDNSIIVTKTSTEDGSTVELKINIDPEGGIILSENGLQIDTTKFVQQSELLQVKSDIAIVNTNLVTAVNAINQNMADGFNTINGGINDEIRPAIEELKDSDTKSVKYQEFDTDRKTIQLNNYDNLSGIMTDGEGVNLAMVSKWDKADFGSTKLPFNMNGSEERPTYNDNKEIALLDDVDSKVLSESERVNAMVNVINDSIKTVNDNLVTAVNTINGGIENEIKPSIESKISSVELVQDADNQLHYELMVDNVKKGDINIPKDQFLKDVIYDDTTKELIFVFDTQEGEKTTKIDISGLIDTYEAGNGIELTTNVFSIKLDPSSQSYIQVSADGVKIIGVDEAINDVNTKISDETTRAEEAETKLSTDIKAVEDGYKAADIQLKTDVTNVVDVLNVSIDKKVDKQDGKGLSTNDFTDADKVKLNGLDNYDDTAIKNSISANTEAIETNKNSITSNTTVIEAEVTRAEAAEKVLTDNLNAEITRSTDADKINSDAIKAEEKRALLAEKANTDAVSDLNTKVSDNKTAIATKVDKEDGKGLSTNDFTDSDKTKLDGLENFDATNIQTQIDANLDSIFKNTQQITGEITRAKNAEKDNSDAIKAEEARAMLAEKTNTDAITALDTKVSANTTAIATKVDKETGKGLSTNDFTTAEKNKLAKLENYDDKTLSDKVTKNTTDISDEISRAKEAEKENYDAIAKLRTDLANEVTGRTNDISTLTQNLNSEIETARKAEEKIDAKIDNITNNGLELKSGKSISAEVVNPTGTPVNILTVKTNNDINVGSNIGALELESKGNIKAIIDGVTKTVAIKEDVQSLIDTLQNALNALTARVTALETPNP